MTFSFELPPKSARPKNGICVIYCVCRLTKDGQRFLDKKFAAEYSENSGKIRVDCKDWIPFSKVKLKKGERYMRVSQKNMQSAQINNRLDQLEHNARIIQGEVREIYGLCTPEKFKIHWDLHFSKDPVMEYFDKYVAQKVKKTGKHNKAGLATTRKHLKSLGALTFHSFDRRFPETFIKKTGLKPSSARVYLSHIKSFLSDGIKNAYHRNKDFEVWEMPKGATRDFYLTYEEVRLMLEADLSGMLANARDFWIFCFSLGLRYNEVLNIRKTVKDGIHTFSYKVSKQKDKIRIIPFTPPRIAIAIYDRYQGEIMTCSKGWMLENIKKAALKSGIAPERAKKVTIHSARHTFITLARERGFSREQIRMQTGQSESVIKIYDHAEQRSEVAANFVDSLNLID